MQKTDTKKKYQLLINKHEQIAPKHFKDLKVFFKYSSNTKDVCPNIHNCRLNRKCKILTAFSDLIADMLSNKKLESVVFLFTKKTKYCYCFYHTIVLCSPKKCCVNSPHHFITKTSNKRKNLQQIPFNHLSDKGFDECMKINKKRNNEH